MKITEAMLGEAYAAGKLAYTDGGPAAPAADPTVCRLLPADLPVGGGAVLVYRAFARGWDAAADEAAAQVLTETEVSDGTQQ